MSTETETLKTQAESYRKSAQVLYAAADTLQRKAGECEAKVLEARRGEAFERVAKVMGELQETSEGCDAVLELVNKAVADVRDQNSDDPEPDWTVGVAEHLDAFALVFTLDRDALESWVSDVAFDTWQDEQHDAEIEAGTRAANAYTP